MNLKPADCISVLNSGEVDFKLIQQVMWTESEDTMTTETAFDRMAPSVFGNCPECGAYDGYLNVGKLQYAICISCRTAWCMGSNPDGSWLDETERDFRRNREMLATYRHVTPVFMCAVAQQ